MPTIEMNLRRSLVSVIVVSYNTRDQLRRCLSCIEPEHEIIVVDNASVDGSTQLVESEFPHVTLLKNKVNEGFGAANNRGMAHSTRPFTLFLNSDCYAEPGAISELASILESRPNAVAVGGRLLNPNGSIQHSAANMLSLKHVLFEQTGLERALGGYWTTPSDRVLESPTAPRIPIDVGQIMGACLMIRTGSITFDERYFLYCEDTDLIYRLVKQSLGAVLYVPWARFTHELGASSEGAGRWKSIARYNRGKELFFRFHFGPGASLACWTLNRLGALLRLAGWTLVNLLTLFQSPKLREKIGLWGAVLTVPLAGPPRPDHKRP